MAKPNRKASRVNVEKDKMAGASPRDDNGTETKNVQSGPWDM